MDDPRLFGVYERAEAAGHVFVLHVGTLPYRDAFTGRRAIPRVMARFPRLRVCVAHMGAFQSAGVPGPAAAVPSSLRGHHHGDDRRYATPYTGADPTAVSDADLVRHQDRVLFGSDFPLIPYDYDQERRWAWERGLDDAVRRKIFHDNALRFFALRLS